MTPTPTPREALADEPVAHFINAHEGLLRPPLWTQVEAGSHPDFTPFELRAALSPAQAEPLGQAGATTWQTRRSISSSEWSEWAPCAPLKAGDLLEGRLDGVWHQWRPAPTQEHK